MSVDNSEKWLSDMGKCLPQHALSTKRKKYHWQVIEYEAEHGLKGVMLSAGTETEAPDVTYPLDLHGWYAIHIGIIWTSLVKLRLKDDPCFSLFEREANRKPHGGFTLQEAWKCADLQEGFWKCADLTGQHLVIGQEKRNAFNEVRASLAYVRLVPLSGEEVERLQHDRAREDTKRLIAHEDAYGVTVSCTKECLLEAIEPYRNTDFKKLFWEIGCGETSLYGSKLGRLFGEGCEDFPRVIDRCIAQSLQALISNGIDPLKTAMEYAHSIGMEFHVSQRVEGFQMAPPWEEVCTSGFYREHPEFRLVDGDGTEITGLSYAYREARDYYISFLKEAAGYGADGAAVIFVRAPPIILYEKPLIDGFQEQYGVDPRKLDEKDERWLRYRAGFVTQFMRELRQAMDEVGEKLGRRLEMSAITLATGEENLFYGLDVETWVKEGLVDNLIAYPHPGEIDMQYYAGITQGSGCRLYPNVMPRQMPHDEFRKKALAYYEAGADGLFFWDTNHRRRSAMWAVVRRLSRVDELKAWAEGKERAEEGPRTLKLLKLGGHTIQKYSPCRGL